MDRAAKNRNSDKFNRFVFMGGHDQNITNFLILTGLNSYECKEKLWKGEKVDGPCVQNPTFAASVIFELYEEDKGGLFVEVLYNNERVDICGEVGKDCTYDKFVEKIKSISFSDMDEIPLLEAHCFEGAGK